MNRGSAGRSDDQLREVVRFNEAPIHESGKFVVDQVMGRERLEGFNEAPIHESGK